VIGFSGYSVQEVKPPGGSKMGHVFADMDLSNPRGPDLEPVRVKALADTGALMLCIPEHVALQLKLETESMREVSLADGRSMTVPYVGPIRVRFGKRFCYVGALVLGDEVLLGDVPMEDMDLVVSPNRREITVDPSSPNIPHARVKAIGGRLWRCASNDRRPAIPEARRSSC
jgi:clan AA aspartic protease